MTTPLTPQKPPLRATISSMRRASTYYLLLAALLVMLGGCGRGSSVAPKAEMDIAEAMRAALTVESGEDDSSAAVEQADSTGFATLKGRFLLDGSPPKMPLLPVKGDDVAICAPGGAPVFSNAIVVGKDGGLANVLLYVTSDIPDNWLHEADVATATATVDFDQKQCIFLSRVFAMRSTQTLKILNSDPIGHNTNITPKQRATPFNQTIGANSFALYTPGGEERAPFPVSCSIHPWMKAWMITRGNPYFAVTDKDGYFEIPRVPSGVELEFRVWHELPAYIESATLSGVPVKWPKGRMKISLEKDATVDMNVSLDAGLFN